MSIQEPVESGVRDLSKFPREKLTLRTGGRKRLEFQATARVEEVAAKPLPTARPEAHQNALQELPEARGIWAVVALIRYNRGFAILKAEGVSIYLSLSLFPQYQTGEDLPITYGDFVDCEVQYRGKRASVKEIFAIEKKKQDRR